STPFFLLIYELVPGTKFFRAPSTIIYVFAFVVSVLAALGTERLIARDVSRRLIFAWLGVGAVIALLATTGALTSVARGGAITMSERIAEQNGYPATAVPQIAEQLANDNAGAVIAGGWRSFAFLALAAGAMLLWLRGTIPVRVLGIALAAIIAVDLWSIGRLYWQFSPPARTLYASDPVIELLRKEPQPGRVVVVGGSGEGVKHPDPYYGTNMMGSGTGLMVHGIRSILGYHGNELGRYDKLKELRLAGGAPVTLSPSFWAHENARYLYTNRAVADSGLKLLAGPVQNSAGSTVYLYRLPGDNPYAWVATGMAQAPDSMVLPAVVDPRFDPRRIAVFSDTSALQMAKLTTAPPASALTTTTSAFGPGHATIALSEPAPAGATLVVSENYYPGWGATVDGIARPVYRADYNLIGVPLPAGARTVELTFRDAAIGTGKAITIVAVLLALLALAGGVVMDRRQQLA
ncbi:MAG: YfhO family protein, partial [bacterium]